MFASIGDTAFATLVSFGVVGLAITGLHDVFPKPRTSDFFQVHSIEAERVGSDVILHVDRDIHIPIEMSFSVRVLRYAGGGYREHCRMSAVPFEYQSDAMLPDVVTLAWWTHGACPDAPANALRISTTWTPVDARFAPVTVNVEVAAGKD